MSKQTNKTLKCYSDIHFIFVFCIIILVDCDTIDTDKDIITLMCVEPGTGTESYLLSRVRHRINFYGCGSFSELCFENYCLEYFCIKSSCFSFGNCPDYCGFSVDYESQIPIYKRYYINSIVLNDPLAEIKEDALFWVEALTEFKVHQSAIKKIPNFEILGWTIETIVINASRLTSLEGKHLQNLRKVKELIFCHNSIQFIHPDVFKGTENVEYINFSFNNLTSIPSKLLDPMKKLHFFSASHNNLLRIGQIFSVTHPKFIYLDFNRITSANRIMHFDLGILRHRSEWEQGDYIELVDLSYNSIEMAPSNLCYTDWFNITLYNRTLCMIRQLRLVGNELQKLTALDGREVLSLDISRNQIQYLTGRDFISSSNTTSLELQQNQIQRMGTYTFAPVKSSLSYLDLSVNKITSINGSVKYLSKLEYLNFAYNSIQSLAEEEFVGVYDLFELHLQHNQIKAVGLLQQFNQLRYLDISYNAIESIRPDHVPKNLREIFLAGNPLKCNCYLQPFIDLLKANKLLLNKTILCSRSDLGQRLQKKRNCPELCSCRCTTYKDVSFMLVDCSSKNLSVMPQFFKDPIIQMEDSKMITFPDGRPCKMDQTIHPSLHIEDRVLGVSLNNNKLESLDSGQLPPNLILLDLSSNKFGHLSESALDNQQHLKSLYLSGNPWNCNCDALSFKKSLAHWTENQIVQDASNIRCGETDEGNKNNSGKVVWNLHDGDFCPPADVTWILSVLFGVLTVVILCVLLYTKYEFNVKIFLYDCGLTFVKEEDLDYDKEFDAFLSFSHKDDKFVIEEIISVIQEKEPNIRLCFSQKDFLPGELIIDNITHAVQSSKRTVLILTKDFFESEWCLLEFKAAHKQAVSDKVHRIIMIKVGDLPKEVDPTLDLYLKTTTYLSWGESGFWKKFLFILPRNCNARNPVPRYTFSDNTDNTDV